MALTMTADRSGRLFFFLFRTGNNSGTEDGSRQRGVRDTQAAGSEEKKGGGKLVVYSPNSEGLMNATIPLFEENTALT